ncbi:MAG: hypothetical protein JOY53_16460 [Acidobacteriaceae bacterium]|nr:hypothetical protein [Acidobacteriaceae bacterium]
MFQPREFAPPLKDLSELTEEEFRSVFRHTPVWRAKYAGFLRNVAISMGNAQDPDLREPLEKLGHHKEESVATAAKHALSVLDNRKHYIQDTQKDVPCISEPG